MGLLSINLFVKKTDNFISFKFNYLPSCGYNLTPFGSEFIFTNYFFTEEQSLQVNINYGDQTFFDFYSGGAKVFNLFPSPKLYIGAELQVWWQPELQLEDGTLMVNNPQMGGMLKADVSYFLFENEEYFGLFAQAGYKTKGYTLGRMLNEGLSLQFRILLRVK